MKKEKKTLLRLFSSSRPWTTPPPPPQHKNSGSENVTLALSFCDWPHPVLQKVQMTEISSKRQMFRAPLFLNHICVIHQSLVTMAQATEQGG